MSAFRVVLVLIQAFSNQLACTPPNPTPPKGRYHTEELYILRIAPFIFKCHQIIFWLCAIFEVLYFLNPYLPSSSSSSSSSVLPIQSLGFNLTTLICPAAPTPSSSSTPPSPAILPIIAIRTTPCFIIGVMAVVLGAYVRLDCFRALGQMFTFDLTIHPSHTLVTDHFYAYVRHPAYTGSLLLVGGLTLSHLTKGSWLTECGPLSSTFLNSYAVASGPSMLTIWVWVVWWIWTICVGVSRADAEDKQMKKLFKDEWDVYAANVPWWFFPGVI